MLPPCEINTDPLLRTNTGYLIRAQPEFGRGSKAGGEVGRICRGKKGRPPGISDHRLLAVAGSGLPRSRVPCVIGLGSIFGFASPELEVEADSREAGSHWASPDHPRKMCTGGLVWLLQLAPAEVGCYSAVVIYGLATGRLCI